MGFALSAALVLSAAAQAHEERWLVPGSIYLGGGVGAEWVNMSDVEAFIVQGPTAVGSTDGNFWTRRAEFVIGFADGEGLTLPDPIGRNARIEGRIRYTEGDSDETHSGLTNAGFIRVDTPSTGGLVLIAPNQRAFADTQFETYEADLIYQTDLVATDWLAVSPLVGLTYTRLDLDNEFGYVVGGAATPAQIDDDITADYFGLVLGADFLLRPLHFLQVDLGLRADLMGAQAFLDVDQDLFGESRDESDGDGNFAARLWTTLAVTAHIGRLDVGVEGFARYLSYLPLADHPLSTTERASNIDGSDLWSVGWMARLTLWLF